MREVPIQTQANSKIMSPHCNEALLPPRLKKIISALKQVTDDTGSTKGTAHFRAYDDDIGIRHDRMRPNRGFCAAQIRFTL